MRKHALTLTVMLLSLALVAGESFAQRGGRGGGGRVGGGGFSGGARPSINRSPSMSRPSVSKPSISRPSTGASQRPSVSRPSVGQLPSTRPGSGSTPRPSLPSAGTRPSLPSAGQRPGGGNFLNPPSVGSGARPGGSRPPTASQLPGIDRGKIQGSIGSRPSQRPSMPDWFKPGATPPTAGQLPARPGTGDLGRPGSGQKPGVKPPIASQLPAAKPPIARPPGTRPPGVRPPVRPPVVRPPVAGRPPRPWYPGHPGYPAYRPGHWWKWATAGAITGWVVHRWANPIYYSYGSGGTVYYDNNVVYVNGQEYGSAEQYYNDTEQLAHSVPETTEEQAAEMEWMPLGVFAITSEGVNTSSMYLQLALSKNGIIAGTFYNESTGVTHPVEGMVDETTQRAAWMAADGTNPNLVMETGIYNLTQDQAPVLVHFGPGQTQNALLVRLDESERPEGEAAPASQGGVNLNLPGAQVQVGADGVQVRAPGVNVDAGPGGTSVSAPAGVEVNTAAQGTQVTAPGVSVQK